MAGGRTLGILGGLVAAAVAMGLWLALASDTDAPDVGTTGPDPAAVAPKDAAGGASPNKTPRRRAKSEGTASIAGLVKRRAAAAPAAGQQVQLLREGFEPWTADTDASGAFRIESLPDGGPFELRVEAKGYATVRLPGIGLGRGEARDAGTIWLDRAVRLPVSVRDFADRGIAGAEVRAFVAPEYGDDFDWSKAFAQMAVEPVAVATTTTDAQGAAVFPELASGTWTITASAPGRARGAVRHIAVRGGEESAEVVVRLAAANELSGRVLDPDRKPVAGAVVLGGSPNDAWDLSSTATRARATSDATGRYVLPDLDTGDVALWVGRAGTVPSMRATVRVPSVRTFDVVLRATGSIAGIVTEKATGKPVEGATVRATQWGMSMETAEAATDAQGRYRIESFPAGTVNDVRAEKTGLVHVAAAENVYGGGDRRVHAGDTLTQDLVLVRGGSVTGRVTAGGAPVAGAKVILRVGRPNHGVEFTETATSDADGRWRVDAAMPGPAFAEARKEGWFQDGFPEQWWMLTQDTTSGKAFRVEVPESGEATLDLVLTRGAAVKGRVEGPDGPVAGAKVWSQSANATSAADGTFALDGVTPGPNVAIVAQKRGLAPAAQQTFEIAAEGPATEIVLRLGKTPVVRGRVTTADGSPLRDARVVVQPKTDDAQRMWINMQPVDFRNATPVREGGAYEAEIGFTEGSFVVHVLDTAHGTAESPKIAIEEGRAEYQADIRLGAGGVVRGRVTSAGRGVAGASVSLSKPREAMNGMVMYSGMGGGATVWAVTGADGAFEARPVGDGAYDVKVAAPGFVRGEAAKVQVPQQGEIVVEIAAALEIAGRVAFDDGKPAEGLSVTAQAVGATGGSSPDEMDWNPGGDDETGRRTTSDRDGRFRLRGLAPGSYRIRVEPQWMSKVNVKAATSDPVVAGATDVKVTVRAGGTISGRVIDAERKPVVSAWISCNPAKSDEDATYRGAVTGDDGVFEVNGLGEGSYNLFVQAQAGGHQPTQKADVASGTKGLEIVLSSGLAIDGVVVKADGKPLSGVYLQAQRVRGEDDQGMMSYAGASSPTDAQGRFRLAGLAPGRYRISMNDWSGSGSSLRLQGADDVTAGATGVRIVAAEGLKIAGVVVDEAGAPVKGARVNVILQHEANRAATCDEAGRFEISGLPEGRHRVHASAQGRAPGGADGVAAGARDVRIVLVRGFTATGRVLDAAGKPFEGQLHLTLADHQAGAVSNQWTRTDADGRFTAEGLSAGKWNVAAFVPDPANPDAHTTVPAGTFEAGAVDVELRITK